MYTLEHLIERVNETQTEINGRWVAARPATIFGAYGLIAKIKDAWEVLRGRADAFKWPEGQ